MISRLGARETVAAAEFRGRVREQRQRQETGTAAGAAVRVCEVAMVTSGSFGLRHSRWAADVKGKPDPRSGASHP